MKKAAIFGLILALLAGIGLVLSCEGPTGPIGPAGPEGPDWNAVKPGSANEIVSKMRAGWNLGNTFDLGGSDLDDIKNSMEASDDVPVTTEQNMLTLKNAGFNAIRIPVSWSRAIPDAPEWGNGWTLGPGGYTIDPRWLARIKEVVDYVVINDMYAIIDAHHDDGLFAGLYEDPPTFSFGPTPIPFGVSIKQSAVAMRDIWKQIAEYFIDYDNKLIFEDLNEPKTAEYLTAPDGSNPQTWQGGTAEQRKNLNYLHQVFVDTVRATGGKNVDRILMFPTYAASATDIAMADFVLPTDVPENRGINKFIVDIHSYAPYNFALNPNLGEYTNEWSVDGTGPDDGPRQIIETLNLAVKYFVSRGIPVVWGEMSVINRYKDNDNKALGFNDKAREDWTEYFFAEAKKKGIPCFWWDNGHLLFTESDATNFGVTAGAIGATINGNNEFNVLLNRHDNTFPFPFLVEAIQRATK
jgi:endoglucanase